ncbi:stage II sporulation protein M [Paenibacillus sp. TRM 82003]|nr:stage II sporulation protein M [Paenibacillus sp. TRM 82003]
MLAKDLVSIKWYLLASALLFFIGAGVGYGNEALHALLNGQISALRDTVERMEATNSPQLWMFLFIFFNNFIKSVLIVFMGALFGLIPVYFLVMNGMILGFVAASIGASGGNVLEMLVIGILPHGVLELTAVMIAAGYGMKYGVLVFQELGRGLRGKAGGGEIKAFHGKLKRLIAFLFLALLAAAFIESTITYSLVRG